MSRRARDGLKTVQQIGEELGVSRRTIQYYDNIGLLPASERSPQGYRLYDDEAVEVLQTILKYKEMGFELKEIHEMIYKKNVDYFKALCMRRDDILGEINELKAKLILVESEINKQAK